MTRTYDSQYKAIVIGVSAGGIDALRAILSELTADFPLPVLVVQHVDRNSDSYLAQFLNQHSLVAVKDADEKEIAQAGIVYLAPANYHLLVEEDHTLSLSVEDPVNYARPSIDVLFETAAEAYGSGLIGIILTGANKDGSHGLKKIKEQGGLCIVQDPATAYIDIMPLAALAAVKVDYVLTLESIGHFLNKITGVNNEQ